MKQGKLYGVGVGPGDKELITVKALRIIEESAVIMTPVMANGERTALKIVEEHIRNQQVIDCFVPMTKDALKLKESYDAICETVEHFLKDGKQVAFLTLGDPTIYSSYMHVHEEIKSRGYDTELIPGVPSFCAAAARLNTSLCERNEALTILPASYPEVREGLARSGTKVLMKAGREILNVKEILTEENKLDHAQMVECCGMENEKIYRDMNELNEPGNYFSLIIVKE